MDVKKINDEVFYTEKEITRVSRGDIEFLKKRASLNKRRRVRLCSHKDPKDSIHEMLIIHAKGNYIPPHKHPSKIESNHIIEGNLNVIVFGESGNILEVIPLGDYDSRGTFYYRLPEDYFHTVIPLSEFVIFHETTRGPFQRKDTVFADWAPKEDEYKKQAIYLDKLMREIKKRNG